MNPRQFRRFIQPALIEQCAGADNVLYHLDGPDAIKHLPALMEVEGIDALQWTSGSYNPDGSNEKWFDIYDQVVKAKKGLWVQVYDGTVHDWIRGCENLFDRYGKRRFYFVFPDMLQKDADILMNHAVKNWQSD